MWMIPASFLPSTPTSPRDIADDPFVTIEGWEYFIVDEDRPWTCRLYRRVARKLDDIKWEFLWRFHPKHRYNVVHTGLEPGYYDPDFLLETCMVKIFKDFVEIDKPFEHWNTEGSHFAEHWGRIRELHEIFASKDYREMSASELTGYLHEIVDLRGRFWT